MKTKSILLNSVFLALMTIAACGILPGAEPQDSIRIAISKSSGKEHYIRYALWLKSIEPKIQCVDMISLSPEEAARTLETCCGLVLSGGGDVHPGEYGKQYDTIRCDMEPERDSLEFALIHKAEKLKMPILAICRGEQILNVAKGGSLIVDIPSDWKNPGIHRCDSSDTCFHDVKVSKKSSLFKIVKKTSGTINTNHHQAVDKLAKDFKATAWAPDGIIEAYEWKNPKNKSWLVAVQWHPERLGAGEPLSTSIGKAFIEESAKFLKKNQKNKVKTKKHK